MVGRLGAVIIGAARVMVGGHDPSDVWGAMVVGSVAVVIVFLTRWLLRPFLSFTLSVARLLRLAEFSARERGGVSPVPTSTRHIYECRRPWKHRVRINVEG